MDSKKFILIGFISMILLLLASIYVWHDTLSKNTGRLKKIANEQLETTLITTMRDTTQRRAIALYRMNAMDDPFERDEEFLRIRELGTEFLQARDELFRHPMTEKEKKAWQQIRETMNDGGQKQHQVLNLIQEEEMDKAKEILIKEVVPTQDNFVDGITNLLDLQRTSVEKELESAAQYNQAAYKFIGLLVTVALAMGLLMLLVLRRTDKTEQELVRQGQRIRSIYEVTSKSDLSLNDQINEMLNTGCQLLNLDCGRVCRVERENHKVTVVNIGGLNPLREKTDSANELDETICGVVAQQNKPLAIKNIRESEYRGKYKSFRSTKAQSYIGTPIQVHNMTYGTVNFYSTHPRETEFSETDKDLINLISSWISVALDRILKQEELHAAKETAESANQTKSAFLANMSHELRTPLNAIIGYSEILSEEANEKGLDDSVSDIEKINASGHHLLSLIDDVLDLSKIEAGRMELQVEEFTLMPVIEHIVDTLKPAIERSGNELNIISDNENCWIRADKTRLKQVLFNLLSNATKFTQNGTVTISIMSVAINNKPKISIKIKDTGIGMTPKQMSKLFEAFSQGDVNIGRKYGGTGLGLAICKKICALMDGEISVDSVENVGTSFEVIFPAASKKPNAAVA